MFNAFNNTLISQVNKLPIGLSVGQMGCCIYLANQNSVKNDQIQIIINNILDNINSINSIDVDSGFAGISLGLEYLKMKRNIIFDDNIIKTIDDNIFYVLSETTQSNNSNPKIGILLKLIIFLIIKVELCNITNENSLLYKYLVEDILVYISSRITIYDIFEQPSFNLIGYNLPLLYLTYALCFKYNIATFKIDKIIRFQHPEFLTIYPRLNSNRLQLYLSLCFFLKYTKNKDIISYKEHLEKMIIVDNNAEFRKNHIFLYNGLAGYLLNLYLLNNIQYKFECLDSIIFFEQKLIKIVNSIDLESIKENHSSLGLISGYAGLFLLLQVKNDFNQLFKL